MIERIATLFGGIDEHAQILARRLLPDKLVEALGPQRSIHVIGATRGGKEAIRVSHGQVSQFSSISRINTALGATLSTEIFPIVEFFKLDPCPSKQGAQTLIFDDKGGKNQKYRAGVKSSLLESKGIYVFYDSRGRAIYAGKTNKQNLWKEINLAYNRDRGNLQKIRRTKQISKNIAYQSYHEKERVVYEQEVYLHELAAYVSAYHISPEEMIGPLEALIVRAFANDLLNKKMEKFD